MLLKDLPYGLSTQALLGPQVRPCCSRSSSACSAASAVSQQRSHDYFQSAASPDQGMHKMEPRADLQVSTQLHAEIISILGLARRATPHGMRDVRRNTVQCRHEVCLGSERRIPCSQGMWGHIWCSLHKNQQQIFNVRIQGDTRFPFTQKEHMVDTGTGSPQASSTYSMEAYFSASTSIKVAGIKGWHSTSVLTRFGHQKCKLSLLLQ